MKRSQLRRGDKPLKRDPEKGLKRTSGLKPGDKPLKADAGKVREFKQRAVANSNRRDPLPDAVKELAYAATEGCCVVCGSPSWIDPHHILPVQHFLSLELEWRNVIPLCRGCHDNHERHNRKVRVTELPRTFFELLDGHDDRVLYLERYYDTEGTDGGAT